MEEYVKDPYTYDQHIDLLQSRGLKVDSKENASLFLQHVNYYRFTGYCFPFQDTPDHFIPGSTFKDISSLYLLDEHLRSAMLRAISKIEVCFRTRMAYELSHLAGPFSHYNYHDIFHRDFKHNEWINPLEEETSKAKEPFLKHYKIKYSDFPRLPLWMVCEIMNMGQLSKMYEGLHPQLQRHICSILDVKPDIVKNWLHSITYIRNVSAHHSRLWNRKLQITPTFPNKDTKWTSLNLDNTLLFTAVVIIEWIYRHTNMDLARVETIHEVMKQFHTIRPTFLRNMGVPNGREIGMCFD